MVTREQSSQGFDFGCCLFLSFLQKHGGRLQKQNTCIKAIETPQGARKGSSQASPTWHLQRCHLRHLYRTSHLFQYSTTTLSDFGLVSVLNLASEWVTFPCFL